MNCENDRGMALSAAFPPLSRRIAMRRVRQIPTKGPADFGRGSSHEGARSAEATLTERDDERALHTATTRRFGAGRKVEGALGSLMLDPVAQAHHRAAAPFEQPKHA
jgi:hypothetical protein